MLKSIIKIIPGLEKERKAFEKISKILEKELIKNGKSIDYILKKTNLKKQIKTLSLSSETSLEIDCYSKELLEIINSYLQEQDFIKESPEKKEALENYNNLFENHIERNLHFLKQHLIAGSIFLQPKGEKAKEREEDKKTIYNKHSFYLDDLYEIINRKGTDSTILETIYHKMIKNVGQLNQSTSYISFFKSLITHKNFPRKVLIDFLSLQMSVSEDKGYIKDLKNGDDLDLNKLKKIILKSKILKHHEINVLTTLPYISLWKDILDNYLLGTHLIKDFLTNIFKYDKENEKIMIIKFLRDNVKGIEGQTKITDEINFMIDKYLEDNKKIIYENLTRYQK